MTIAIIGGGFSGALTAVGILRSARADNLRVILVDNGRDFGRGLAYRAADPELLLNVPAGNMSALADQPDDFVKYLQRIDVRFNAGSFVPRAFYGDYLEHTLAAAERACPNVLVRRRDQAVALQLDGESKRYRIQFEDGQFVCAARVVLALGHFQPELPRCFSPDVTHRILLPWDYDALDALDPAAPVAVMGMGHTGIDVLLRLKRLCPERKVFMFSRRGLLPHAHRPNPTLPAKVEYPKRIASLPPTISAYAKSLRTSIADRVASGGDWRDALNELRPHTASLWRSLPLSERARFLRRFLPYWDIHRHRLAPVIGDRLQYLFGAGLVERIAGTVRAASEHDGMLNVVLDTRSSDGARTLSVSAVINCTGPNYDLATVAAPLVQQLLRAGRIRPDPLRLGLDVDDQYRLIDAQGRAADNLFYVGPMLRARHWEAVAVPELRQHASALANKLVHDLTFVAHR
ncbi:FAD/NAD(P)-binding protein [Paraburkholderia phenoliruptrix]|uniref:FAD/NAD(P)-binding protein n=1 Tax=Paraburkholderia phenoliruptrix TaxID=252970 RepID=UPI003D99FDA7